ncbi:MAG: AI-2E family transporter [Lachnospiraceae bacterium]|nr:AI-2E family transporter [Lachnospiraceae bacterium]
MQFPPKNKYLRIGLTAFLVIAASLIFYFLVFHMDSFSSFIAKIISILMPIIYAAAMAYLFSPLVKWLELLFDKFFPKIFHRKPSVKARKVFRLFAILLTICAVLLCIYAILAMLIPQIITSIASIADNFPRYLSNSQEWFSKILKDKPELESSVTDILITVSTKMQDWLTNDLLPQLNSLIMNFSIGIFGLIGVVKNLVIGIIVSVYILFSKESLIGNMKKGLYSIFSQKTVNQMILDTQYINKAFGGFITGRILDSAIIGLLCYIGMSVIGLPYTLLISVIVGLTNVIPYFGPFMGAIPSFVLIFMVDPRQALYFAIFILVLQQIDGNIIGPMILRGVTGLTSFMVIVAIIIGGGVLGVFGMIIGVPVCMVLCTIVRNKVNERLRHRNMPTDPEFYRNIDHLEETTGKQVAVKNKDIKSENLFRYRK